MTWKTVLKSLVFIAVWVAVARSMETPDYGPPDYVIMGVTVFASAGLVFWRNHLRLVALAMLAAALASATIQGIIYQRAERTEAEVVHLSARYSWSRYGARTTFGARVRYTVGEHSYEGWIPAGFAKKRGSPVEEAAYRPGDKVTMLYDPRNPAVQFEDSLPSVFIQPILIAILAVGAWALSMRFPARSSA